MVYAEFKMLMKKVFNKIYEKGTKRYLPLNFNSLLNHFSENMSKAQLVQEIKNRQKVINSESTHMIIEKYGQLVDLSKVNELNLERQFFYETYKKKLKIYKQANTSIGHKYIKSSSNMFSTLDEDVISPKSNIDFNHRKVWDKSNKDVKSIMQNAKMEGKAEARKTIGTLLQKSKTIGVTVPFTCMNSKRKCFKDYFLYDNLVLNKSPTLHKFRSFSSATNYSCPVIN